MYTDIFQVALKIFVSRHTNIDIELVLKYCL